MIVSSDEQISLDDETFVRAMRGVGGYSSVIATEISRIKKEFDWFFELYLRQPKLPKLVNEVSGNTVNLSWETPNNMPFPMPIDVEIDGKAQRIEMKDGKGSISFTGTAPVIDSKGWVLKAQ